MAHWTLDDVPWDQFDRSKLDPELIPIVKAASMVEYRAGTYTQYLHNVFHDDAHFKQEAAAWALEEVQHGQVLGRYAKLCDPDFDFEGCYQRFVEGYALQTEVQESIRGSRAGELIARCIVEVGTSSYYTAMAEATDEPVLKDICKKIAADELRHYKLFYSCMKPYLEKEGLGFWGRLRVAAGRIAESEDDELAYAYYAANGSQGEYDHKRWNQAYARRAYSLYKRHHVERVTSMVFKAVGLKPHGMLNRTATQIMWTAMRNRVKRLEKIAA